jgi:hypothetical protein
LKIICLFFVMISVEGNPKVRKQGQNKAWGRRSQNRQSAEIAYVYITNCIILPE